MYFCVIFVKILCFTVMEISFAGNRYGYKIFIYPAGKEYDFAVKAIDKESRKTSWINTVNKFLGALDIDPDDNRLDERFVDSDWIVSKKELKKFVRKTYRLFTDKEYLPYFEDYLDFDRREGEWENFEE